MGKMMGVISVILLPYAGKIKNVQHT